MIRESVGFAKKTLLGSQSAITIEPDPMTEYSPIVIPSLRHELTPINEFLPMMHLPEMTTCEVMNELSSIVE